MDGYEWSIRRYLVDWREWFVFWMLHGVEVGRCTGVCLKTECLFGAAAIRKRKGGSVISLFPNFETLNAPLHVYYGELSVSSHFPKSHDKSSLFRRSCYQNSKSHTSRSPCSCWQFSSFRCTHDKTLASSYWGVQFGFVRRRPSLPTLRTFFCL